MTSIRNTYEHQYSLPDYKTVQGYLDSAELWVEASYRKYTFDKIGIVDLGVGHIGNFPGERGTSIFRYSLIDCSHVDYLSDSRQAIVDFKNDEIEVKMMADIEWEKMVFESKHICFQGSKHNKSVYNISEKDMELVYNGCVRHAKTRTRKFKEAGKILDVTLLDHIILTDEDHFSFTDEGLL